ncbi:hypothetical protein ACLNGM_04260 [Aureimonas phyllosphaerae]|uniref:hypothetical protein n=1 Tax=Aureimonas phyllosphaerae TaxID=1166078 RepID=UPI003A5C0693
MADVKDGTGRDEAQHGGGIGDVGRQPIDQTSENPGNGTPQTGPGGTGGTGLAVDEDATPSDEDPDRDADETLGTVV